MSEDAPSPRCSRRLNVARPLIRACPRCRTRPLGRNRTCRARRTRSSQGRERKNQSKGSLPYSGFLRVGGLVSGPSLMPSRRPPIRRLAAYLYRPSRREGRAAQSVVPPRDLPPPRLPLTRGEHLVRGLLRRHGATVAVSPDPESGGVAG